MHDDGFDDFFKSNFTSFSATVPLTKDELHAIWKTAQMLERRETQSRWVKCSERLPEQVGSYMVKRYWPFTSEYTSAYQFYYGQKAYETWQSGWEKEPASEVVAWLENVPEFVP